MSEKGNDIIMLQSYKYTPEQYKGVLGLQDEMQDFYNLFEKYQSEKTIRNKLFLEKQLNDLLFTIKHREIEGNLAHSTAAEIREYVRVLLDD